MKNTINQTPVPDWARALSDEAYFAKEQACLGELWNFLGFEGDIPNVNDWFRATLGGRSIFVQRFKEGLRAFENICPHRFNQIRSEDKGNSPVVCSLHHWRFNSNGDAVGIPKCKEYYGKTPQDINARLNVVELAVCGGFIFGRFGSGESLEAWLGDGYDSLNFLAANVGKVGRKNWQVQAHWKLMMQINLDDYHIVAVHPTTFGKNGYLNVNQLNYERFGAHDFESHSALSMGGETKEIATIAQECRAQQLVLAKEYLTFHLFPNVVVSFNHATRLFGDDYHYMIVQHFKPQSTNQTNIGVSVYLMPFNRPAGVVKRVLRHLTIPIVNVLCQLVMNKVHKEDNQACERLQKVSHQIESEMRLSAGEQRLGWFEQVYAKHVTARIKQKNDCI